MYSQKLKKVKKSNLRNKRYVVNNKSKAYAKHTNNALKTNIRYLRKNSKNSKKSKITKSKKNNVLYGGANGPQDIPYKIKNDDEMKTFSILPYTELIKIKELSIANYKGLTSLPESIGNLKELTTLLIMNSDSLISLPNSLCDLKALKQLIIYNCNSLTYFPPVKFGSLQELTKLSIYGCRLLTSLPINFGGLQKLTELTIENCDGLTSLPDDIGLCFNLKTIQITKIDLLPSSVFLLMPNIKVNNKIPYEMNNLCVPWITKIRNSESTKIFYTTPIATLLEDPLFLLKKYHAAYDLQQKHGDGKLRNETAQTIGALHIGMIRKAKMDAIMKHNPELNIDLVEQNAAKDYKTLISENLIDPKTDEMRFIDPIINLGIGLRQLLGQYELANPESISLRFLLLNKEKTINQVLEEFKLKGTYIIREWALYIINFVIEHDKTVDDMNRSKFLAMRGKAMSRLKKNNI